MSKTLYLVRHAKAELFSEEDGDFERNLINKGRERALRIATELSKQLDIDNETLVISSSANRAKQTADIFCEVLGAPVSNIVEKKDIYNARYMDLLRVISMVPDHFNKLLVFGHNPGVSDLAGYLTNIQVELHTSNLVIIDLDEQANFSELSGGTANLRGSIS